MTKKSVRAPKVRARASAHPSARSGILTEMTIADVRAFHPEVGVIGIGSTEPHGPHLPYGTDTFILESVTIPAVRRANAGGARVLYLPSLPISLNNNMRDFPFGLKYSVPTFMNMLADLIAQFEKEGVMKIVLVNAHGGNPDVLRAVQRDHMKREGAFVCLVDAGGFGIEAFKTQIHMASEHAGEYETSMIMHAQPELVREECFADNPVMPVKVPCLAQAKAQFVRPWWLYLPVSAGGDNRQSTAAKGEAVTTAAIASLAEFLTDLSKAKWHKDFPF
ncbi:MAG: creatininase family protein [Planctomycetota bacterium]